MTQPDAVPADPTASGTRRTAAMLAAAGVVADETRLAAVSATLSRSLDAAEPLFATLSVFDDALDALRAPADAAGRD